MASMVEARVWAEDAKAGDYLARYSDDEDARCGYDDAELDEISYRLRGRGLRLVADDRGLRAEVV